MPNVPKRSEILRQTTTTGGTWHVNVHSSPFNGITKRGKTDFTDSDNNQKLGSLIQTRSGWWCSGNCFQLGIHFYICSICKKKIDWPVLFSACHTNGLKERCAARVPQFGQPALNILFAMNGMHCISYMPHHYLASYESGQRGGLICCSTMYSKIVLLRVRRHERQGEYGSYDI
jgi:hypothetical protein